MSRTEARKVTAAERRLVALRMRREGRTYADIAAELGCGRPAAYKMVAKTLSEIEKDSRSEATALRALELERLDQLQLALWYQAEAGDVAAVDRILRIMERRAKLLGLDAPARIAPTDPAGQRPYSPGSPAMDNVERARRITELLRRAAKRASLNTEGPQLPDPRS